MDGLVIGLDLNDEYTQISCYGKEISWTIPTVICRKKEEEIWLTGEEAYAATLLGEGVIVDKLLKMVQKEGTSTIGGVCYTGALLLRIFLQQVLEYPLKEEGKKTVSQLVVTMQEMDARLTDTLMYCADAMGISRDRVHVISHTESFVYYVLSQKRELWSNQVGLFELAADRLCYYEMKVQRGMRRNMVQAEAQNQEEAFDLDILGTPSEKFFPAGSKDLICKLLSGRRTQGIQIKGFLLVLSFCLNHVSAHSSLNQEEAFDLDILGTPSGQKLADQILTSCGEKLLSKKLFSTVFLTGKGFERQDWAGGFMKLVCSRRRCFVEKELFSRGAAFKGQDYLNSATEYPYIFVCEGRLKAEVDLKVMQKGKEVLLAVASYGDNWYESKSSLELILEDENTMVTVIKDRGFGDLFPASGAVVRQEVSL